MKSIWLDYKSGNYDNKLWLQLFEDFGVVNNHEIINIKDYNKLDLIKKIIESDQICFVSSFVSSSDSFKLLQELFYFFTNEKLKDKKIVVCGDLIYTLNSYCHWRQISYNWIEL